MSKKLLLFLLQELTKVRITCKQCKSVMEVEIACLNKSESRPMACAGCGIPFRQPQKNGPTVPDDAFNLLANAVKELTKLPNVEIEFPLYQDDNH